MLSFSPVTYTAPSFSASLKDGRASIAGAFSMSPVVALKQAIVGQPLTLGLPNIYLPPCHGQVILPSPVKTPLIKGAP